MPLMAAFFYKFGEHCNRHGGVCVHEDDMQLIEPALFSADVIAFVTPLYYFGMTAQLKCVVDRMYAPNEKLRAPIPRSG